MLDIKDGIDYSLDFNDYSNRWVSYFDLLGFSELVNTREWFDVWLAYSEALKSIKEDYGLQTHMERTWFSDTFVLYSSDDNNISYCHVEALSRAFVYSLVRHKVPVRGAMSYGKFYANKEYHVFFGPALIEAYDYGEHQG